MAKSVGERARQHAEAVAALGVDRDIESRAIGVGQKPIRIRKGHRMRNFHLENRTYVFENRVRRSLSPAGDDIYLWSSVSNISFVGLPVAAAVDVMDMSEFELLQERLEFIRRTIPDIWDIHENSIFSDACVVSAPARYHCLFDRMLALEEEVPPHKKL